MLTLAIAGTYLGVLLAGLCVFYIHDVGLRTLLDRWRRRSYPVVQIVNTSGCFCEGEGHVNRKDCPYGRHRLAIEADLEKAGFHIQEARMGRYVWTNDALRQKVIQGHEYGR